MSGLEEAKNNKVQNMVDKINALNTVFDQAERACSSEIVEFIDEKTADVKLHTDEVNTFELLKLELMIEDFKKTRESLNEIIDNGRKLLNVKTLDLLDRDNENSAADITSFAELVHSVNQTVKSLGSSYRDIASVLESIEKIRKSKIATPDKIQAGSNNVYIDKMVVQSEPVSTMDIISRLREKNTIIDVK